MREYWKYVFQICPNPLYVIVNPIVLYPAARNITWNSLISILNVFQAPEQQLTAVKLLSACDYYLDWDWDEYAGVKCSPIKTDIPYFWCIGRYIWYSDIIHFLFFQFIFKTNNWTSPLRGVTKIYFSQFRIFVSEMGQKNSPFRILWILS